MTLPGKSGAEKRARRAVRFTEAELKRAMKIATMFGPAWGVDILTDGTIRFVQQKPEAAPATDIPKKGKIVV